MTFGKAGPDTLRDPECIQPSRRANQPRLFRRIRAGSALVASLATPTAGAALAMALVTLVPRPGLAQDTTGILVQNDAVGVGAGLPMVGGLDSVSAQAQ
ncbi:MAG: hypothetical protein K9H11_09470, partial [Rhodospirillum sp.]|nr:hypothetical protein [Rhodospirillum sp.]